MIGDEMRAFGGRYSGAQEHGVKGLACFHLNDNDPVGRSNLFTKGRIVCVIFMRRGSI
jgi:hypothetical protein